MKSGKSELKPAIQRTVMLTVGDVGAAVGKCLTDILEKWQTPPVVAVVQLDPDEEISQGPGWSEAIETAIRKVSRLSHRTTVQSLGYSARRLEELVVWIVGASTAPLAEVARLSQERADAVLGVDPLVLGFVIGGPGDSPSDSEYGSVTTPLGLTKTGTEEAPSPHSSDEESCDIVEAEGTEGSGIEEIHSDEDQPTADRASEFDTSGVDPVMVSDLISDDRPSDPPAPPPLQLPAGFTESFIGPCYVATSINEAGLVLDNTSALYDLAARFLALHTCTPLCDAPVWVEQSHGWDNGVGCVSIGLAWVAWPSAVAQRRAERWMAERLMPELIGTVDGSIDVEALLREAKLLPPDLIPQLTPEAARDIVRSSTDEIPHPGLPSLFKCPTDDQHPILESLEGHVAEWEEKLAECAEPWEKLFQESIKAVGADARAWVAAALDRDGFRRAGALIAELDRRFAECAVGTEQRYFELEDDLSEVESQARDELGKLTSLLEKMPQRRLRDFLVLIRRPSHWVQLWLRWRKIRRSCTRYTLLRAATLEMRVASKQMKQACGLYWAADSELESISRRLDHLERHLSDSLTASGDAREWPPMPFLTEGDPDQLLEELMQQHLPAPESAREHFLAALGPLSAMWAGSVPPQWEVEEWLESEVQPLADVSTWDVIRFRQSDPEKLRLWLQELSAHAVPLWRWDSASLSDHERAGVGTVTVLLSPSPDGMRDEDNLGWQVLPLSNVDGLAVITLRWGIRAADGS